MNFAINNVSVMLGLCSVAGLAAPCMVEARQCGSDKSVALAAMSSEPKTGDIVETAIGAGSFKTLVAAVQAAGLVGALQGEGPFTVFAPTDAAFAKLPAGTIDSLLKPENREKLKSILLYHVAPGRIAASDVLASGGAATLNGQRLDFAMRGSSVQIDLANVVKTDIECTNGIIHVIDAVILPSSDDIVMTAEKAGSFSTLLAAATKAGLVEALKSKGPITVFAPTDDAFSQLPAGTVESLLKPENKDKLAAILKYHVVSGRVLAADAVKAGRATTLQGSPVTIDIRNGRLAVNGASVIASDIDASNGVVHVIDRVILPPTK